jgi:hypothetical protein
VQKTTVNLTRLKEEEAAGVKRVLAVAEAVAVLLPAAVKKIQTQRR